MRSLICIYISCFAVSAISFYISFLNFRTTFGLDIGILGVFFSVVGVFVFGFNTMKEMDEEDKAQQTFQKVEDKHE